MSYTPPLEGMIDEKDAKLDRLAHSYHVAKAAAKHASQVAKEAGAELAEEMLKRGKARYSFGGVTVDVSMDAKVKVQVAESRDAGDEESEDAA